MKTFIKYFAGFVFTLWMQTSWAGELTIPNSFSAGTPAVAAEVNANFQEIETEVNDNHNRITANEAAVSSNTSAIDNLQVQTQNLVTGCPVGESIRAIAADGTLTCDVDNDSGGDITSVSVGSGLTGGSDTGDVVLGIDQSVVQQRVTGTCAAGSYVVEIAVDGSVVCTEDLRLPTSGTLPLNSDEITYTMGGVGTAVTIDIAGPQGSGLYKAYRCLRRAADSVVCLDLSGSAWEADFSGGGRTPFIFQADFTIEGTFTAPDVFEITISKVTFTNIIYSLAGGN